MLLTLVLVVLLTICVSTLALCRTAAAGDLSGRARAEHPPKVQEERSESRPVGTTPAAAVVLARISR
jgi:hypothetical protein